MLKLKQYNCALFDCDGVILDSNTVKTNAFRDTLKGESAELISHFIDYHQAHGGVSRYDKFQYFYQELTQPEDHEAAVKKALLTYGQLSREGLINCNMIAGIERVLEKLKSLDAPCYVLSGGDEKELNDVFNRKGIAHYFQRIMGSPKTKLQNMNILKTEGLLVSPGVFFGDSKSDCDAAMQYKYDFVFVSGKSEWRDGLSICEQLGCKTIDNFKELIQ